MCAPQLHDMEADAKRLSGVAGEVAALRAQIADAAGAAPDQLRPSQERLVAAMGSGTLLASRCRIYLSRIQVKRGAAA